MLSALFPAGDTPRVLVVQSNQRVTLNGFAPAHQAVVHRLFRQCESCWFWPDDADGDDARNLKTLIKELRRLTPRRGRQLVLCAPESAFDGIGDPSLRRMLEQLEQWASRRQSSILFLVHGEYGHLKKRLVASQTFSGLAFCQNPDSQHLSYHVSHWLSERGVQAGREWLLARRQSDAQGELGALSVSREIDSLSAPASPIAAKQSTMRHEPGADDTLIYTTLAVLADGGNSATLPAEFAPPAEDNTALFARLEHVETATVVFACDNLEQAKEVGVLCYQLRRQFGPGIKIAIRETRDCLRYAEEQFLLLAGVNLIIPHSIVFSLFVTQITALEGQWFYREIPEHLDALLEHWPQYAILGYVAARLFIEQCRSAFDQATTSDVDHILVCLRPARQVNIEDCLSLCHLRRNGDVITAVDDELYILFRACRLNHADIALRNSFALPVEELFTSYRCFIEDDEVEQVLARLQQGDSFIDAEAGQSLLRPSRDHAPSQPVDSRHFAHPGGRATPAPMEII